MDHITQDLNLVMEIWNIFFGVTAVLDQRVFYYHVWIHLMTTISPTAIMVVQLELNVIVRGYIEIDVYAYCYKILLTVVMVILNLLEENPVMKEMYKYVLMEHGDIYVIHTGTTVISM